MQKDKPINNYLVWSILSTVLCCLPLGVVAMVYSARVETKSAAGDREGAVAASDKAKLWCWLSFGGGILFWLSLIGLVIFTYLVAGSLDKIKP